IERWRRRWHWARRCGKHARARSRTVECLSWSPATTSAATTSGYADHVAVSGPHAGSSRRARSVRRNPRRGASAAHPRPGPVGDLAFIGLDIGAPCLGRQGLALMDDAELAVCLDLTDHDRLCHVMLAAHHDLNARWGLDPLAHHHLTHRLDIRR